MAVNPFDALGLPARPDLTDEQVRAAWRKIAAATHPDRRDGGDVARYTEATAAYAVLRTPWGRSEAFADLGPSTTHLPCRPLMAPARSPPAGRPGQFGRRTCSPPLGSCPPGSVTVARAACSSAPPPLPCFPWACCT